MTSKLAQTDRQTDRQTNGRARLESQRIAHDNIQADVEAVPIEFANLKRLPRRRRRHIARHAIEVTGTGESCAACETAQALRARHLGQGPDAHALRVEGIVGSSETHLPTLAKKVGMEVHQTPEPCAQAVAGRRLLASDALGTNLLSDPVRDGWEALQQVSERRGYAGTI